MVEILINPRKKNGDLELQEAATKAPWNSADAWYVCKSNYDLLLYKTYRRKFS